MEKYDPEFIKSLIEKSEAILEANKKTADSITEISRQIIEIQKKVDQIVQKLTIKGLLN